MKKFNIILATDLNSGISINNQLPWRFMKDLNFFNTITKSSSIFPEITETENILIMGRKTFESLKCKKLKNRKMFVITSNWEKLKIDYPNIDFFSSFHDAYINSINYNNSDIWVIGGSQIYNIALRHWACDKIYWTQIKGKFTTDVFIDMTNYLIDWTHTQITTDIDQYTNQTYELEFKLGKKIQNVETQYLSLLYNVINNGDKRQTRNAITFSKFNNTLKCNLSHGFPLLTTKKMFWKGIVEELLFFIRGNTDTTELSKKGIKIWELNTSKNFLDSVGLNYKTGSMGPMYGYQWRHWNKPYQQNVTNQQGIDQLVNVTNHQQNNIDQLVNVINEIKNDPHSRRILMTDFNPSQVSEGVLYPCHSIIIQFYVESNKLSCTMYQRSGDLFLGIPFNIASTSLLLHIISKLTNLEPYMMNLVLGDYHIYDTHLDAVMEQLNRTPKDFPQIIIPDFTSIEQVEKSEFSDYKLINYHHDPTISAQMIA